MSEDIKHTPEGSEDFVAPVSGDDGEKEVDTNELDTHEQNLKNERDELEREYKEAYRGTIAFDLYWIAYNRYGAIFNSYLYRDSIIKKLVKFGEQGGIIDKEIKYESDKEYAEKIIDAVAPSLFNDEQKEGLREYLANPSSAKKAEEALITIAGDNPTEFLGYAFSPVQKAPWTRGSNIEDYHSSPNEYEYKHSGELWKLRHTTKGVDEELRNADWQRIKDNPGGEDQPEEPKSDEPKDDTK